MKKESAEAAWVIFYSQTSTAVATQGFMLKKFPWVQIQMAETSLT
jgi:hypothetical protein